MWLAIQVGPWWHWTGGDRWSPLDSEVDFPLVICYKKAIENGHLQWIYPLKIMMFHSYVSLPEGYTLATIMVYKET